MAETTKYAVGQVVGAVAARYEASKTKPPERYTESSLIDDMLNAHKFASSDAERRILRETEGLGTSRTREQTITGLINKKLIQSTKKGKSYELISDHFARTVVANLPDYLSGVATTAKWEVAFSMIESGKVPPEAVMAKVHELLAGLVSDARARQATGTLRTAGAAVAQAAAQKTGVGGRNARR